MPRPLARTKAREQALQLAAEGRLFPVGTGAHQLADRLVRAGLLRHTGHSLAITDEGRAWLAPEAKQRMAIKTGLSRAEWAVIDLFRHRENEWVRASNKTRTQYPWNLTVHSATARRLEKKGWLVSEIVRVGDDYEVRYSKNSMGSPVRTS